jgi:hypothetical protein
MITGRAATPLWRPKITLLSRIEKTSALWCVELHAIEGMNMPFTISQWFTLCVLTGLFGVTSAIVRRALQPVPLRITAKPRR